MGVRRRMFFVLKLHAMHGNDPTVDATAFGGLRSPREELQRLRVSRLDMRALSAARRELRRLAVSQVAEPEREAEILAVLWPTGRLSVADERAWAATARIYGLHPRASVREGSAESRITWGTTMGLSVRRGAGHEGLGRVLEARHEGDFTRALYRTARVAEAAAAPIDFLRLVDDLTELYTGFESPGGDDRARHVRRKWRRHYWRAVEGRGVPSSALATVADELDPAAFGDSTADVT
ncbi:type I-E CRISPR-associated protein Cse2/CasB [Embleya scabrispora]|uniref:type I-E CRISPR-associated protein Cse2/CasB n=1 Tax=Embleya scabrispora TaxID=159449 RepID=UPI0013752B1D|nr:type I-E CRISPR-associated protein Cse2/CasB [Embleya scabrispora]